MGKTSQIEKHVGGHSMTCALLCKHYYHMREDFLRREACGKTVSISPASWRRSAAIKHSCTSCTVGARLMTPTRTIIAAIAAIVAPFATATWAANRIVIAKALWGTCRRVEATSTCCAIGCRLVTPSCAVLTAITTIRSELAA